MDDRYKYIFIRIPKTASTSIVKVLPWMFPHWTPAEWREKVSNFDSLYKFSFVRNPYERFLSMYYFFGVFQRTHIADPNEFLASVDWEKFKEENQDYRFVQPQYDYLYENGKLVPDFIGRYENLAEDWLKVANKIHVSRDIPILRKTMKEKAVLSDKSKEILYEYYKKDFEAFGYNK